MKILFLIVPLFIISCGTFQETSIKNRHYTIYRMQENRLNDFEIEFNAQKYIQKGEGIFYSIILIDKRSEKIPGGVEELIIEADGQTFRFSNPDKEVAGFGANDKLTGSWFRYKLTKSQFKHIALAREVKVKISMNYSTIETYLSPSNKENLRKFYKKHK